MKRTALVLLLAALSAPAMAEDFPFGSIYPEIAAGAWEEAVDLKPAPGFFDKVALAGAEFELDATPMSRVAELFGGSIQTWSQSGYVGNWLCYVDGGRRVWFLSDVSAEDPGETMLSQIVDEPADAATDAMFGCTEQPLAMLTKQAALPGIGATLAELAAFYKAALPAGTTRAYAFAESEGDTEYSVKTVYYRLVDGVVDGLSIAQGGEG